MLHRELLVVRLLLRGLRLALWKINFQQDQILVGVSLELRFRKDLAVELDAPAAPIRAGEINSINLLSAFAFSWACLKSVSQPGLADADPTVNASTSAEARRSERMDFTPPFSDTFDKEATVTGTVASPKEEASTQKARRRCAGLTSLK
jgi:hypothetical protein